MAPQPDVAAATALVQAQAAARARVDAQTAALVAASVRGFDGWYDSDRITEWATGLAARVEPLQRVLAQITDGYLARMVTVLSGRQFRPVGEVDVAGLRGVTTHAGAYGRVADAFRWQQAQLDAAARGILTAVDPQPPLVLQTPEDAALQRAQTVAAMDTLLPVRAQTTGTLTGAHEQGLITGYRRVIHPEMALKSHASCGMCITASLRIYRTDQLMPIHHGCHCLPSPVTAESDVGAIINRDDLKRLYAAAGSTGRADLKRTRYTVTDDGELGPLLEPEANARRLARKAAQNGAGRHTPKTPVQRRVAVERLRDSLVPALDLTRQMHDGDPQKWAPLLDSLQKRVDGLDAELRQLAA